MRIRWASVSTGSFDTVAPGSVEEVREVLLDRVGDVERARLDRARAIHAARRDEDAAVDDEQVLHVVAAPPAVHDGGRRVVAHARRAHQVPARRPQRPHAHDIRGAGRAHHLFAAFEPVLHQLQAVLAVLVGDLRCGDATPVDELRVERHRVVLFRQILADDADGCRVVELLREGLVVALAPRNGPGGEALHGRAERTRSRG